ncbi:MAG: hypothetical protein ACLFVU_09875 [Phycisphaerae bacterium]
MKRHRRGATTGRNLMILAGLGLLLCAGPALGKGPQYLHQDVTISGEEVYSFQLDGKPVTVFLGSFRLSAGKLQITGRDAVAWISGAGKGTNRRHDITLYVEGNKAKVVEPDGTTIQDRQILITLHIQGRLDARGNFQNRDLKKFPLVIRARAAKKLGEAPPPSDTKPTTREATEGPEATPERAVEAKAVRDLPQTGPAEPVSFHFEKFSSQEVGENKRITVARGNVYVSQGNPDSRLFLELRADSAVIFSEVREDWSEDSRVPYLPKAQGLQTGKGEHRVTGVYLEGDVVISRGERSLRTNKAFYDLVDHRAIATNTVFRTIQEQRKVPVYVRAKQFRALSSREMLFKDAKITTSDFHTPSYHIGVEEARLKDETIYDPITREQLSQRRWGMDVKNATLNVNNVPFLWWPRLTGDLQQEHTPLRRVRLGQDGDFGYGVETEWHFFRLLGLEKPAGLKSRYTLAWYERGLMSGLRFKYARQDDMGNQYTGYAHFYGVYDSEQEDDFGDERDNIPAPELRGRAMVRHKYFFRKDWQLQFELSYLCDRNFLEEFFPGEFYAGKEQETLLYVKRQEDNWALEGLMKFRLNDFLTQTEALPEVRYHLIGESLWQDRLTFFSENRLGLVRYKPDHALAADDSRIFTRADTRNEVDWPLKLGPIGENGPTINMVPYAVGRQTFWGDTPGAGSECRSYGQVGLRANTSIWRVYDTDSRLWDLNGLKHVLTPEVNAFASDTNVHPDTLYPLSTNVENSIRRTNGVSFGLLQRLVTYRGPAGSRHRVDWMRLNVVASFFDNGRDPLPSDGRWFFSRPEYSLARNHVNADYLWNISDSAALLADANYDIDDDNFGTASAALSIARDPRLRYYIGARYLRDLDSGVGTFGLKYDISKKYSLGFFQQYDFDYQSGDNLATKITLTRKFERLYASFSVVYDDREGDVGVFLNIWPEGIPEARFETGGISVLKGSNLN